VPVIAAISGICYGGGMGLAAACDLRLADETARFCVPAARLGLAYPADAVIDFVSTMGAQRARQALFTGAELPARMMQDCGFLLAVTAPDRLMPEANDLANAIAANAPLSVRASKLAIRATIENSESLAAAAIAAGAHTFDSQDYAEGRQAFAERRKPHFTGE
jgi:enoyl-CoA hydratase/carnithine racemase